MLIKEEYIYSNYLIHHSLFVIRYSLSCVFCGSRNFTIFAN
jgi:hypothetical protein